MSRPESKTPRGRFAGAGRTAVAVLLLSTSLVAGCRRSAAPEEGGLSGKLVLTGSSTIAPLAAEIGRRFEELHPGVRIDVQTGGSSRGIADARSGTADIGMASRALKAEEEDLLAFPIAGDGVSIIVHRDNPVEELTDEQVVAIYTGEIQNWKDVGGLDAPITVVHKADGRATLEVFLAYFQIAPEDVQPDVVIGDNQQGIKTVVGNPNAIGYVSVGTADYESRRGTPIKLLPAGGTPATPENVASGAFPISRPLNLVAREEPKGLAAAFLDYARSPAVFDLIEAQYFVPVEK
ncbi:MAG: phosphate ABC transporter substrate-binding protein [Acidobacteria bacterium]|nr:phosphate ABC transporter substrate-binding protein [Acidobacteriota bacterium]